MAEYIERESLLERMETRLKQLRGEYGDYDSYTNGFDEGLVAVEDATAADVVEVRHGEWTLHKDGNGTCNQCGVRQKNVWDYDNWQNYCGHCGAKMDGDGNDAV